MDKDLIRPSIHIHFHGLEPYTYFIPDFGMLGELYAQGYTNDIDLAMQKPQYKDIVSANLRDMPIATSPGLSDDEMIDNMVSREYDVNELRELANFNGNEYRKSHSFINSLE